MATNQLLNYILGGVSVVLAIVCIILWIQKNSVEKDLLVAQNSITELNSAIDLQNQSIENQKANIAKLNKSLATAKTELAEAYAKLEVPEDYDSACAVYVSTLFNDIYTRRGVR